MAKAKTLMSKIADNESLDTTIDWFVKTLFNENKIFKLDAKWRIISFTSVTTIIIEFGIAIVLTYNNTLKWDDIICNFIYGSILTLLPILPPIIMMIKTRKYYKSINVNNIKIKSFQNLIGGINDDCDKITNLIIKKIKMNNKEELNKINKIIICISNVLIFFGGFFITLYFSVLNTEVGISVNGFLFLGFIISILGTIIRLTPINLLTTKIFKYCKTLEVYNEWKFSREVKSIL